MAFTKTTLQHTLSMTVTEILARNVPGLSDKTVVHSLLNKAATYDADSAVPVTKVACFEQALSGGAATIDLTTLNGVDSADVDGVGLKVQFALFVNKSTNDNPITIAKGASNGYTGFGAALSVELQKSGYVLLFGNQLAADIAAGCKTLDLAGTGTDVLQ